MKYWFNDYIENIQAPQGFVTKVMVKLESRLCDVGDTIIKEGKAIENLVFIVSGSCELNGIHKVKRFNFEKYRRFKRKHIY